MPEYSFELEFSVRDYECDMQGIVNNAVYQHYLEHARHEYLNSVGLNFAELTRRGIHLVVIRAELDYKQSLKSGDKFCVSLIVEPVSALRFCFVQDIYRLPERKLILQGRITGTGLNERRRPELPREVVERLVSGG